VSSEKILFVDDEPSVLDGFKRLLHREFSVVTAVGPEMGLTTIQQTGPYAVVVSDMRMPVMNGAQFLAQVRKLAPDSIRIALTGYADIETSIHAVNEGNIFRFLTKPCPKEVLAGALHAALDQNRLVAAEKELLEKTLMGSVKVLTEVIGMVNPLVFSCATRIQRSVRAIVDRLRLESPWRFEVAAMLSQLGCVVLQPEITRAIYAGQTLSPEDQTRFDGHPRIACDLLGNIPRLEPIAWMIEHQQSPLAELKSTPGGQPHDIVMGARILSVAVAYDRLLSQGDTVQHALQKLRARAHIFDPTIVGLLEDLAPDTTADVRTWPIADLQRGMILQEEIRTQAGVLVVAKGQEVTHPLTIRLRNFLDSKAISGNVIISMPKPTANEDDRKEAPPLANVM
jgi:response regulator RpfG family c-di-GMP phosphodiesterase